jgi:hypothetical protein
MKQIVMILLCAWVLWQEMQLVDREVTAGGASEWSIVDAFEKKKECGAALTKERDQIASEKLSEGWERKVYKSTVFQTRKGKLDLNVKWQCLPAGTDPRPRYKE